MTLKKQEQNYLYQEKFQHKKKTFEPSFKQFGVNDKPAKFSPKSASQKL
jgi:hypothetical protein